MTKKKLIEALFSLTEEDMLLDHQEKIEDIEDRLTEIEKKIDIIISYLQEE